MSKFVMGIDGGGTKGHLAIYDLNGARLGFSEWGPLNHEAMAGAFSQLEEELGRFITGALNEAGVGMGGLSQAVLGLAGVDTRKQHEIISGILRRIGLERFVLCNDGYLGVAAGCPGGVGICAINGTGSVLTAVDTSGEMRQVGGIGSVTDDCGGSGWYGARALSAVYRELYKFGPATALTRMMFDRLNVSDRDDYVEAVTAALADGSLTFADPNRLVFTAAAAGDAVSIGILDHSAEHYARCVAFLAKNMDFPADKTLHMTLAGSVFAREKTRVLPDLLSKRLGELLPERRIELLRLEAPPVMGAVMWALREIGVSTEDIKLHP